MLFIYEHIHFDSKKLKITSNRNKSTREIVIEFEKRTKVDINLVHKNLSID